MRLAHVPQNDAKFRFRPIVTVRGCACFVGLLLALACLSPTIAKAQGKGPAPEKNAFDTMFSDVNAASPQAVHFSTDVQNIKFVLDRSQPRFILLRFEGDPEVWALTSSWGPRGDEFLRNDIGEVIVRITSLGGVTLYGPLGANGAPASRLGKAKALPAPTRSEGTLQLTVERAIGWFSRFGQRSIRVEAAGGLPPSLVYEALQRAVGGMSRAPRGFFGQFQRRITLIKVLRTTGRPSASWENGVLMIYVVPGNGYAGRPSSAAILAALVGEP